MKYDPTQDWRDKIATINRLAANFRPKREAMCFVPVALTDEVRDHVESVTRFERDRSGVVKQNWRRQRMQRS